MQELYLGNHTNHLKFYIILCQKHLKYILCQIKRINKIYYVDRHTPIGNNETK